METTSCRFAETAIELEEVEALERVLSYLWSDELDDYLGYPMQKRPGHIFEALVIVARWLADVRELLDEKRAS